MTRTLHRSLTALAIAGAGLLGVGCQPGRVPFVNGKAPAVVDSPAVTPTADGEGTITNPPNGGPPIITHPDAPPDTSFDRPAPPPPCGVTILPGGAPPIIGPCTH